MKEDIKTVMCGKEKSEITFKLNYLLLKKVQDFTNTYLPKGLQGIIFTI